MGEGSFILWDLCFRSAEETLNNKFQKTTSKVQRALTLMRHLREDASFGQSSALKLLGTSGFGFRVLGFGCRSETCALNSKSLASFTWALT